jgi:hypothetical protein
MDTESYPFTIDELRRLAVYRDAVRAGFFTEWITEPRSAGATHADAALVSCTYAVESAVASATSQGLAEQA